MADQFKAKTINQEESQDFLLLNKQQKIRKELQDFKISYLQDQDAVFIFDNLGYVPSLFTSCK